MSEVTKRIAVEVVNAACMDSQDAERNRIFYLMRSWAARQPNSYIAKVVENAITHVETGDNL